MSCLIRRLQLNTFFYICTSILANLLSRVYCGRTWLEQLPVRTAGQRIDDGNSQHLVYSIGIAITNIFLVSWAMKIILGRFMTLYQCKLFRYTAHTPLSDFSVLMMRVQAKQRHDFAAKLLFHLIKYVISFTVWYQLINALFIHANHEHAFKIRANKIHKFNTKTCISKLYIKLFRKMHKSFTSHVQTD